jgi:hypothetical protein
VLELMVFVKLRNLEIKPRVIAQINLFPIQMCLLFATTKAVATVTVKL